MSTQQEYRIFGLRRSGNHLVVSALLSSFNKGEVYYYNDVVNPNSLFAQYDHAFHNQSVAKVVELSDRLVDKSMYNINVIRQAHKKCLIHTYEDKNLGVFNLINKQDFQSVKKYNILVLRDPYNWLASRLEHYKKNRGCTAINPKIIALWKSYAREFLLDTNTLGSDKVLVNYNRFVVDEGYRREVAKRLGVDPDRMKVDTVLGFGKGSSFNGVKKVENKSSYNERWKLFRNDVAFRNLVSDKEMFELSLRIFGPILV